MIQTIQRRLRNRSPREIAVNHPRPDLIQRWVETADERCPLACVWFALPEIAADRIASDQDDEPELPRPAFSCSHGKAGYLLPIHILPAPSTLAHSLKNAIHILGALLLFTISFAANAQEQDQIEGRPSRPAKPP